jgi:hypothetical protein
VRPSAWRLRHPRRTHSELRRPRRPLLAAIALAALCASCSSERRDEAVPFTLQPTPTGPPGSTAAPTSSASGGVSSDRPWFGTSSAFWEPIPASARVLSGSRQLELQQLLTDPKANMVANLISFAVPVVEWDAAQSPKPLTITEEGHEGWGYNDLSAVATLQVPESARPASGTDGKLAIIDRANNRVLDLLAATRSPEAWTSKWGGVYDLDGDGTSSFPAYQGPNAQTYPRPISRGTGSGISSLAGLITLDDVRSGTIEHALVFATDRACGPPFSGPFVPPATTTDGWVEDGPCIEEGARLQLDPSVDIDTLNLDPGERMIAEALQTYGAYCIDNGGSRLGFIFELPPTASDAAVYSNVGLNGDYASLNDLPWAAVRILEPAA